MLQKQHKSDYKTTTRPQLWWRGGTGWRHVWPTLGRRGMKGGWQWRAVVYLSKWVAEETNKLTIFKSTLVREAHSRWEMDNNEEWRSGKGERRRSWNGGKGKAVVLEGKTNDTLRNKTKGITRLSSFLPENKRKDNLNKKGRLNVLIPCYLFHKFIRFSWLEKRLC